MKKFLIHFILITTAFQNFAYGKAVSIKSVKGVVSSTFKIDLPEFPQSFNPSLLKTKNGYILSFRYLPEPIKEPWISFIGLIRLDDSFQRLSEPQLIEGLGSRLTPSQAEDARIFEFNGDVFLIYNDNQGVTNTSARDRRDIFVAEIIDQEGRFEVKTPVKLVHPLHYSTRLWEKNWSPFVYENTLYLSYFLNPHEVLKADLDSGDCEPLHISQKTIAWDWGQLRGGTPGLLVDGEYLAFFHSMKPLKTNNGQMWHYFMGAYTYSATPPFSLTKVSPLPINDSSFYIDSDQPKRVIYPGGFAINGSNIYLAYGKDDHEVWIAVIDKNRLLQTLRPIQ